MARNLQANAALLNQFLDGGIQTIFNSGFMNIRTGGQPADASLTESGTLLATVPLPADAFAASTGGQMLRTGTWETLLALATGTANWFRLKDSGDTYRLDGTVGESGETQTSGTATGGNATALINSAAGMVSNEHRGRDIIITGGTGVGQRRSIAANDSTMIYVSCPWATNPAAGSVYQIENAYDLRVTTVSIAINTPFRVNTLTFDYSGLL